MINFFVQGRVQQVAVRQLADSQIFNYFIFK